MAESPPSRRRHILVAEDDRVLRQNIAMVLVHSGYAVDMAEDGAAAWEALQANPYELLVTDNNMPRLSGIELLKRLRSARMGIPVIMASGTLPTQELAQNPGLEPVTPLAKPYAPEQLLDTVKAALDVAFSRHKPARVAPKHHGTGAFSVERYATSRKLEWDAFVSAAKNTTFLFHRDHMD